MARQPKAYNNIEREFTLVGQKLPEDPLEVEIHNLKPKTQGLFEIIFNFFG